jgi:hypothetical protein
VVDVLTLFITFSQRYVKNDLKGKGIELKGLGLHRPRGLFMKNFNQPEERIAVLD